MKKNLVVLLLSLCLACMAGAFAACEPKEPAPSECNHVYADEYTCHDRTCTVEGCGHVEKATTEHAYGEWTVLREAGCESTGTQKRTCACGEEEEGTIPAAGHKYADEHTCHDRTCTVDDCEHIEPASTAHSFSEWETIKPATCSEKGEKKRICTACGAEEKQAVVKDHEFDQDGVCGTCKKDIKELLIQPVSSGDISADDVTVTFDENNGKYTISSKASPKPSAYGIISGTLLTELTKLGYTQLSFTVINSAPGLADATDKCKGFYFAAESTANLWSESTAIAYWNWIKLWDNGKKAEFTIDLGTYQGKDLYFYSDYCETYPLEIVIDELKASPELPARRLVPAENCEIEYIEGKGWHVDALNTTQAFYANIPEDVLAYYIENGYTTLKLSFVNNFDIGHTQDGNPVNATIAILPHKAGTTSNDWYYCNGFISQVCTKNEETGAYEFEIDLTDESHDFTHRIQIYFKNSDVQNKKTDHFYLTEIEFAKEHTVHKFDKETLKCSVCGKHVGELLVRSGDSTAADKIDTIVFQPALGQYTVTSADTNAYTILDGAIMSKLKSLGFSKLTLTVINPATGLYDSSDKGKACNIAADSTDNLWSADKAIAVYNWKAFWDAGRKVTVEIDLETYAGRTVYIFTDKCNVYATQIIISELIDYTDPAARLVVNEDCSVEYIADKGWHVAISEGKAGCYANISQDVLKWYIEHGYTKLTLSFVNNLDIGYTTEGNPVNATIAILPHKAGTSSNDWAYCNGFMSQVCTKNEETGAYEFVIDLTNEAYDFTHRIAIYFKASDVQNKKTDHFYLTGIEFSKEA